MDGVVKLRCVGHQPASDGVATSLYSYESIDDGAAALTTPWLMPNRPSKQNNYCDNDDDVPSSQWRAPVATSANRSALDCPSCSFETIKST